MWKNEIVNQKKNANQNFKFAMYDRIPIIYKIREKDCETFKKLISFNAFVWTTINLHNKCNFWIVKI